MNKNLKFKVFISMVLLLTLLVSLVPAVIVAETPAEGVNLTEDKKEEAKKDPPDQQGSTGEASEETSESTTEETSEETSEATTEETSEETSEATTEQTSEETSEATTTSTNSSESSSTLPSEKVEGATPLEQPMQLTQMMPLRGPASGPYSLVSGSESTTSYDSLVDALNAAEAGDAIKVSGTITEAQAITITKNITLMAGDASASITFANPSGISVTEGASLTLGGGDSSQVLQIISGQVKVTNGNLIFNSGIKLVGQGVVLEGSSATASFNGGEITTNEEGTFPPPTTAIYLTNGASITQISAGVFRGTYNALCVTGGSRVEQISGGAFYNGKNKNNNSAVLVENGGQIQTISGGTFTAITRAGVEVKNGGWIDTISGGTFKCLVKDIDLTYHGYSDTDLYNYFSGLLICVPNPNPSFSQTGVGQISGGDFSGVHGLYTIGNVSSPGQGKVSVEVISGGKFEGIKLEGSDNVGGGALIGQFTHIDKISGGSFSSNYGSAFYVTIDRGFSQKSPRTWIGEISGGVYQASGNNTAMLIQTAHVGTISGGQFFCDASALAGSKSLYAADNAQIDQITGGLYWGIIDIKSGSTRLEPNLTDPQGVARYWGHGGSDGQVIGGYHHLPITGKGIIYPSYQVDGKTFSYFPSTYAGAVACKEQVEEDQLNQKEWILYDHAHKYTGYFNTTPGSQEGAFDWKDNGWYSQHGYGPGESIYTLEPSYYGETFQALSGLADQQFIFLQRRPALSFDANLPDASALLTGTTPPTQYIRPYYSTDMGNSIKWEAEYNQWEQVFVVPGNPGNLALQGYTFDGWNTQKDGKGLNMREGKYYLMPLKDVTLYAKWKPSGAQIHYDPNGGEFRGNTGITSEKYLIGDKIRIAEAPTRAGYRFLYWKGSEYQPGDEYEVTEEHTFVAQWEPTSQPPAPQPPIFIEEEPEPTEPKLELKLASPLVFKQITGGKAATADVFSFRLEALSYEAPLGRPDLAAKQVSIPMPPDSVMGIKDVTITGEGTAAFGQLVYEEPGSYSYRITEVKGSNPNYQYATDVYTFIDYVYEENGQLLSRRSFYKNGAEANTATAYFTNHYLGAITRDKITSLPATGSADSFMPALALVALGLVIILKKR